MTLAKSIGFIFIAVFIIYMGISLLAHFISEKIIFQPQASSYRDTEQIIKLSSANGVQISATYLHNPEARFTILFSHGNAEDIGTALPTLERLKAMGFSVFAYDYQGYGTSSGVPSEDNAYQDVEAAYNYLNDNLNIPADRIIAYGRSLGGAVAVELAQKRHLGGLIIEGSFTTAYRVVTKIPLFPFDKFKSISKIKQVRCPVLIIHAKKDEVVPFSHGEKLFLEANEPKASFWVEEAGHNNLLQVAGKNYEKALLEFLSLIEKNRKDDLNTLKKI
jgi:abhydrolase domain-containing protein 17